MLDEKLLKTITKEDIFKPDFLVRSKDSMGFLLLLPEPLQKVCKKYIPTAEGYSSEEDRVDYVLVEYWADEETYHWIFLFEYDTVDVSEEFACDYLNDLIRERYETEYKSLVEN